jgi:hypothetical protein
MALYAVVNAHSEGEGVEKDDQKATYYFELAAMKGHNDSRYNLGIEEAKAGENDEALKHWLIACRRGINDSLGDIKGLFLKGRATKEDYEKALRSL